MESTILFNKIWVIQSLREGDLKTGYDLYRDQLVPMKKVMGLDELKLAYRDPETKEEFLQVFEDILKDISVNDNYPIIHIDCHGCEEGLRATTGKLISWEDLRNILVKINTACRLNLIVVLAACNGAYLINTASILDRAPFWAIIGPETEVTAGSVELNFRSFYSAFFNTLNGDAAINALNVGKQAEDREYHFISTLGLFKRAYQRYHKDSCAGKGKRHRIEELVSEAMKSSSGKAIGIQQVRRMIKDRLAEKENDFNKFRDRFFMVDKFDENAERFNLSYDDFLKLI